MTGTITRYATGTRTGASGRPSLTHGCYRPVTLPPALWMIGFALIAAGAFFVFQKW